MDIYCSSQIGTPFLRMCHTVSTQPIHPAYRVVERITAIVDCVVVLFSLYPFFVAKTLSQRSRQYDGSASRTWSLSYHPRVATSMTSICPSGQVKAISSYKPSSGRTNKSAVTKSQSSHSHHRSSALGGKGTQEIYRHP